MEAYLQKWGRGRGRGKGDVCKEILIFFRMWKGQEQQRPPSFDALRTGGRVAIFKRDDDGVLFNKEMR